jgi:hypothetical protein
MTFTWFTIFLLPASEQWNATHDATTTPHDITMTAKRRGKAPEDLAMHSVLSPPFRLFTDESTCANRSLISVT